MAEIILHPILEGDLDCIQVWRNSPNVMNWCRQYRPLSREDMKAWFKKLHEDKDYNLANDLFLLVREGSPIGVGGFVRIDWRNRKAEVSFYVGDDDERTESNITEALLLLMDYAFETLNIRKVYFPVYEKNPNLAIYEKILTREYVAKQEYYWEGEYQDRIILVKYKNES